MTSYSGNPLKTAVSLHELTAQRKAQSDLDSTSAMFCPLRLLLVRLYNITPVPSWVKDKASMVFYAKL